MYVGFWNQNIKYTKGDIVFVNELQEYFICILDHTSNNLTLPSKEDLYWVYVSSNFLTSLSLSSLVDTKYGITQDTLEILDCVLNDNNNNPVDDNKGEKSDNEDDKTESDKTESDKTEDEGESSKKAKKITLKIITSNLKSKSDTQSDKEPDAPITSTFTYYSDDDITDKLKKSSKKSRKPIRRVNDNQLKDKPQENKQEDKQQDKQDDIEYVENVKKNDLKRKLRCIEQDLDNHKKRKMSCSDDVSSLRDRLLLMNLDLDTKSFVVDKYDSVQKMTGSDYSKGMNWLRTVSKLPYGKTKMMAVDKNDPPEMIKTFFDSVKEKLDKNIYGLEDVKQEILEFVAKKITNPDSKGHVLALYGPPGVGKSKIIRSLADALDLPFYQINFGGLNDVSVLTGHSETYVGSKPGKVVEVLTNSEFMNPIIYLDEIDKIGENKVTEIFGILTHMLDEEQNSEFQDNYLSNIKLDLSKVFFVLSFNDITRVDKIVSDRLKIIYIEPPTLQEKLVICETKVIPEIIQSVSLKNNYTIVIDKEVIEFIIACKTQKESGVRQLRKNIEKIINRLNYDTLIENFTKLKQERVDNIVRLIVTRSYVDEILKSNNDDTSYLSMYI
jgi:ATP-dependent Lon protease